MKIQKAQSNQTRFGTKVYENRKNCVYRTPWGSEDALSYNYYGTRRNTLRTY